MIKYKVNLLIDFFCLYDKIIYYLRGVNMKVIPSNCSIPSISIKPGSLDIKFKNIGFGSEGKVYRYNDTTAIKMFNPQKFPNKLKKTKQLYYLRDENFCFPKGLVYTKRDDLIGIQYDFITNSKKYGGFLDFFLDHIPNGDVSIETVYNILFKIDMALQRIHKVGYTVGDLRPKNIMINEDDNPIFIDTDGGAYKDYGYDIKSPRSLWANKVYNKDFSKEDCDKYVWAIVFLESLLTYNNFNKKFVPFLAIELYQNKEVLKDLVSDLSISKEMKDGLNIIFSDADNKPYIGDVFEGFDQHNPIMSAFSERLFALKVYKK